MVISPGSKSPKKNVVDTGLDSDLSVRGYQSIYSYVKEMLGELGVKSIPANELREFTKTLELDLNESKKGKTEQFMSTTLKNMAIFSIHNFCYTRALDLLKEVDTRLFTVFKSLHEVLNGYIRSYFEGVLSLDTLLHKIKNETREVEKDAIDHTSDILTRAETLLEENERLENEVQKRKKEWDGEKKDLLRQNKDQERENRDLMERVVKLSKERAVGDMRPELSANRDSKESSQALLGGQKTGRNTNSTGKLYQSTQRNVSTHVVKKPHTMTSHILESGPTVSKQGMRQSAGSSRQLQSSPPPKLLTLHHLKSIFKDLFLSKTLHDQKCAANKLPHETLEQHLYTFLSTRFGLKNLVVEWVEAIVAAVAHFAKEDHEVALVGKILQNEVDEEFRTVQSEVRRTISELVKVGSLGLTIGTAERELPQEA